MIVRFSACPLAKPHIAYSIQVHASTQLLTGVADKQDTARPMAARAVGILLPPGWPTEAVDALVAFVLAIPRSKRRTTEVSFAEVPKQEDHLPMDATYEAADLISWLTAQECWSHPVLLPRHR